VPSPARCPLSSTETVSTSPHGWLSRERSRKLFQPVPRISPESPQSLVPTNPLMSPTPPTAIIASRRRPCRVETSESVSAIFGLLPQGFSCSGAPRFSIAPAWHSVVRESVFTHWDGSAALAAFRFWKGPHLRSAQSRGALRPSAFAWISAGRLETTEYVITPWGACANAGASGFAGEVRPSL